MAEDFDAFEQYLRQFQPRRPIRPLPAPPDPWRRAYLLVVAAAVLLTVLGASLVWLARATRDGRGSNAPGHLGAQAGAGEPAVTAARLTRAALDSLPGVEDALASATMDTLLRVERADGPLHSLARE